MNLGINRVLLGLLFTVLLLSGCATTQFSRLTDERITLGQSSRQVVEAIMGKPAQKHSVITHGENIEGISYAYAAPIALGSNMPVKSQSFFFHKDILVGHAYTNSWKEGTTNFDESKIQQIKEGATHIDEVFKLLGRPGGEQIYPLTEAENEKVATYLYYQIKKGLLTVKPHQKLLTIIYDRNTGVVTKVSYLSTNI